MRVYILALMVLGAMLRLDLLVASNWVIDADEAIVGLMAQHIVLGKSESWPVFYYGQNYMGSLEPLMVAALFWITGHTDSSVLLKLVPLLWSIALIPIGYILGRAVAGKRAGLVAAAYLALPPSPLVVWSGMARGGFIEVVVMAASALYLAIKWAKNDRPLYLTACIGLILGLGWWTNNQIIFAILPIGLWMLVHCWRGIAWPVVPMLQQLAVGFVAFLVGGLPFWWFNLTHDFVSFEMFSGAKGTKLLPQIGELFSVALPIILGAKRFWHVSDLFPGASLITWSLVCFLAVAGAIASRCAFVRLRAPRDLILLYLVTTCAVFALSSFGWLTSAPRYLLPVYPAIAVLLGVYVNYLLKLSSPLAYALLSTVLGFNLLSVYLGGRAVPGQPIVANGERVAVSHEALVAWLKQRNVSMVETNYWIGYRLAFETNEAVRFKVFGEPAMVRIPEYELAADKLPPQEIPLILVPSQLVPVTTALSTLGFTFESESLGDYAVIINRQSKLGTFKEVAPERFSAQSSYRPEFVAAAFDHSCATRWGSGTPQVPGMEFRINFNSPVHLKGMLIEWRDFPPDYPRGLEIIAHSRGIKGLPEQTTILSGDQYRRAQPLVTKVSELTVLANVENVDSIVLRQLGSDRKFDWSIGEMKIYE